MRHSTRSRIKLNIAVGDKDTADYVSESFGRHYVLREGWSSSSAEKGGMRKSRQGRFDAELLVSSDAIRRFDDRKSLLLVRGHNGAILDKLHFFKDSDFIATRERFASFGAALNVSALAPVKEEPMFEKPRLAIPEHKKQVENQLQQFVTTKVEETPIAVTTLVQETYLVEPLSAAASTEKDTGEDFCLDLPAVGNPKKLLDEASENETKHPVLARLRNSVQEAASTDLADPGSDLQQFIRA